MVKREVVGAHYGLLDWLVQRITAVAMVAYTVVLVVALVRMPQFDYAHWKALWSVPVMSYLWFRCWNWGFWLAHCRKSAT